MVLSKHKITQNLLPRSLQSFFIFLLLAGCASQKARVREQKIGEVISIARTFMGTPYKYGGTTRAGMDCSGLTTNAFRAINLSLPRSAEDQSTVGEKVKQKDLRPGDLLFFATGKKKREITHVGLVTEVIETDLSQDYYAKRYRFARRIID